MTEIYAFWFYYDGNDEPDCTESFGADTTAEAYEKAYEYMNAFGYDDCMMV